LFFIYTQVGKSEIVMKKFSFKKIITVSLFFTSVIFTSGFTICFTDTISTSHSNDQPNATKIDLKDYNGKMLPNRISVPAGKFIDAKALFAQLTLAQGNQSLP
jgi:hypothetical protein